MRAILGAMCYAYALYRLLQKKEILEFGQLIDEVIEGGEIWGRFPKRVISEAWLECADRNEMFMKIHECFKLMICIPPPFHAKLEPLFFPSNHDYRPFERKEATPNAFQRHP